MCENQDMNNDQEITALLQDVRAFQSMTAQARAQNREAQMGLADDDETVDVM